MDASAMDEAGQGGLYAAGLIALPDGSRRGIEEVVRVEIRAAETPARASDVAGALRSALGSALGLPLPLRLAASSLRAGLGAIEEGLRPPEELVRVVISLRDGATIATLMPVDIAILIRRDAAMVRGALERAGTDHSGHAPLPTHEPLPVPSAGAGAEALTSIFRYEKRNGRLRRVAAPESKPER